MIDNIMAIVEKAKPDKGKQLLILRSCSCHLVSARLVEATSLPAEESNSPA
jgi:hypothetical protein